MMIVNAKQGRPGEERKQIYWVWADMRSRCLNPNHKAFHNYGGRGVTVCESWLTFNQFHNDMGPRPDGGMIERIDNNLGYSPSNCRWATRKEQNSNRRNCIYVDIEGETMTLKEACRRKGLTYRAVHKRITARNWTVERALSTSIGIGNSHGNH